MFVLSERRSPRAAARVLVSGLAVVLVSLTGCGTPAGEVRPTPSESLAYACPPGDLLVEGSPSDQDVFEQQVVDYSASCRNRSRITFTTSRDAGVMSFVNGLVQIAAADTALDEDQARQAQVRCLDHPAWHLPVVADPVALVYRVDGVDDLTLSPATLAKVFSGLITEWNDADIAADNPGSTLPAERIEVFSRTGRTGVTEAVGDYLHGQAPEHWPVGGTQSWRGAGQGRGSAQEVIDSVQTTPYSLGYVEHSALPSAVVSPTPTAAATGLAGATPTAGTPGATGTPGGDSEPGSTGTPGGDSVPGPTGTPGGDKPGTTATPEPEPGQPVPPRLLRLQRTEPVALTPESARIAAATMRPVGEGPDLVVDRASLAEAPGGWPIQRITYQIVCSAGGRPDTSALERDWVGYLVTDETQDALAETGRIALPSDLRERVRSSVAALG